MKIFFNLLFASIYCAACNQQSITEAKADSTKAKSEVISCPPGSNKLENGIEVVAVHNHMVHEKPRIFFLHYWGVGSAEQLAAGLKSALNETGKKSKTHG